ncbi:MAG: hypothetical protein MI700_10525, partial [Balneolales bacterium]|nr:hypothetical protein [Balneolales bacterium]
MKKTGFLCAITLTVLLAGCTQKQSQKAFIQVQDGAFILNENPFQYVGTNFWYGAYLGQPGDAGDRARLQKELDFLKEHGITNLRVLGSSEESVFRNSLSPAFVYADGTYDENLLTGMDYLLAEMGKRGMHAVIFLSNYWEWSGGMSMYNSWYDGGEPVDPSTGDWDGFMKFSAEFYQNVEAQQAFLAQIQGELGAARTQLSAMARFMDADAPS